MTRFFLNNRVRATVGSLFAISMLIGAMTPEAYAQNYNPEFTMPSDIKKDPNLGRTSPPISCEPKVVMGRVLDGVADLSGNYPILDHTQIPSVKSLCDQSATISSQPTTTSLKCPNVQISSSPAANGARVPCTSCTGNPQGSCVNTGRKMSCDVVVDRGSPNGPDLSKTVDITNARVRVQARLLCLYDCRNSK